MPFPSERAAISLMPGERVISATENNVLTLTNFRVIVATASGDSSQFSCAALDAVSHCEVTTQSSPYWLALAAVAGLAGIIGLGSMSVLQVFLCLAVAAGFFYAYLQTRKGTFLIHTNAGTNLSIGTSGMQRALMISMSASVLEARLKFLLLLRKTGA